MSEIFIYVTTKDEAEAKNISLALVGKNLVACTNFFPIRSVYKWEGEIKDSSEFVLILKTKEDYYNKVKEAITKLHSYDIPCITKIKVSSNEKYAKWLGEQLS